jgi:SAM-dependent methyltransferase
MGLDLYAKVEHLLGFFEQRRELYEIFLQKLEELGVNRVLDIGCGSGAFLELAKKRGFEVRGVDLSEEMVQRARAKGLDCRRVDICEMQGKYEAAVAVFDVLNYLPRPRLFLECVKELLEEGGYFLADINTLRGFEEVAQGALWVDKGDEFAAVEAEFSDGKLKTDMIYFYKASGCFQKESGAIVQYYHDIEELKIEGLQIVDIDLISLFSDFADKALILYRKG